MDKETVNYYRSLIPKYYYAKPQKYCPHVTIVRKGELELETILPDFSGNIDIVYSPVIFFKEPYFWLNCWSEEIGEIRKRLGLNKYRFPNQDSYHVTIGNTK